MNPVNVVSSPSKQPTEAGPSTTHANGETDIVGNMNIVRDSHSPAPVEKWGPYDHLDGGLMDFSGKNFALPSDLSEYSYAVTGYITKQPGSRFATISEPTQELDPGSSSKTMSENNNLVVKESTVDNNLAVKENREDDNLVVKENTVDNNLVATENTEDNNLVAMKENTEDISLVVKEFIEDESIMSSMLTRSDQVCSTELLEDIIEEARNEKKTLVSTMDSVVELMREVEDKEKAAEEAKEEANRDCSHIFAKVDELKLALGRAKEANDMHAGEVYAEKAILATELKELQLRLFTLSDERNKSLSILDEMRGALEIRLATALKEIEAAEAEKMEKQKFAREALAYQESQLEKVVEESKKLQGEAEENSKLQEFLMDRGRAIDILQGEISVKCQDVRLLKEKFDKRIPLSSSQTSSISASPTCSFRKTFEPEPEAYETPKKSLELDGSYGLLDKTPPRSGAQSPKSPTPTVHTFPFATGGVEKQSDAWKLLLNDDDWELFDKGDLSTSA
ncbi:hypothetical protein L1887_06039 [Cichorium endivia]|nr:hypothetical protein L1887_06039 [Cichorium endivia]